MEQNSVIISNFEVSNNHPFFLIAGPCAIEGRSHALDHAGQIKEICNDLKVNFVYKSSFDKANRSSKNSKRGVGIEQGLEILSSVKHTFNIPILTDVHEPFQCKDVAKIADIIQIPAFLCRQTDLLYFAAMNFKKVNVKKGQWLSPDKVKYIVEKIKYANTKTEVWITERGTAFGYNKLVVDFDAVDTLKSYADQVILDCTHSTQRTIEHNYTSGNPELGKKYMKVAKTFGYDGIFAEIHPTPNKALSDKDSIIDLTWITNNLTNIL